MCRPAYAQACIPECGRRVRLKGWWGETPRYGMCEVGCWCAMNAHPTLAAASEGEDGAHGVQSGACTRVHTIMQTIVHKRG